MRVIDSDAALRSASPLAIIEALRQGHRDGVDAVERILLSEPGETDTNHLLIWPAWKFGAALGAKLVSIFPGNQARDLGPSIRSVYLLFSGDGRPLSVITGESFTRWKTAADSALGASFLARQDAEILAVVGAGAQAPTQIRFLCAARPSIRRISVWNLTPEKARKLQRDCRIPGVALAATEDLEQAVRDADVVSCVTSSTDPVLRGAWLKEGAHVDLVGSFTPQMREADDQTMLKGRIFVDSRTLALAHCGELAEPIARGVIAASDVQADLFDLCTGRAAGRLTPMEITVFKNGGGGHLDLMMAGALTAMSTERSRPGGSGSGDPRETSSEEATGAAPRPSTTGGTSK